MGQEKIPDKELSARLAAHEPEAFQYLIETEKDRILNICFRFVNDREDAEDLAQETFIEIYRSISAYRGGSSLSTWICRIAISRSLNFIRNKGRQKRKGKTVNLSHLEKENASVNSPYSSGPDEIMEQKERELILQQALDSLPVNQHAAFILSKYDEMSYQDIAVALNISVPAVESLVFRARSNLQKKLYNYYKNYPRK